MRAIVTGGGTGGHIYPALAVASAMRARGDEVIYVGGESGPECQLVPPTGIPFHAVTARKLRKLASPSTVLVLWALLKGYRQAAALMREFDPAVVISTGGYVAAATALAAARQGRPAVLMACDAVPGRTNLWLSRWARRLCIWFEETASLLPGGKSTVTGVPIREELVSQVPSGEARSRFGLAGDRFTVLALGGSQGAKRLNELVVEASSNLPSSVQWLHQTGPRNIDEVSAMVKGRNGYVVKAYLDAEAMPLAYRAADVVVCRCGISSLAEVAANGLPSLMVPLPTAYADHQTANARALERAGAGILLPQPTLTGAALAEQIAALRDDAAHRAALARAAAAIGRPDAARRMAEVARDSAGLMPERLNA